MQHKRVNSELDAAALALAELRTMPARDLEAAGGGFALKADESGDGPLAELWQHLALACLEAEGDVLGLVIEQPAATTAGLRQVLRQAPVDLARLSGEAAARAESSICAPVWWWLAFTAAAVDREVRDDLRRLERDVFGSEWWPEIPDDTPASGTGAVSDPS